MTLAMGSTVRSVVGNTGFPEYVRTYALRVRVCVLPLTV